MALYAQCQRHMLDLQRELRALNMNVGCGGVNGEQAEAGGRVCAFQNVFEGQSGQAGQMGTHGSGQGPLRSTTGTERSNNNSSYRKAKVLYAYEALAGTELTVKQNEVGLLFTEMITVDGSFSAVGINFALSILLGH